MLEFLQQMMFESSMVKACSTTQTKISAEVGMRRLSLMSRLVTVFIAGIFFTIMGASSVSADQTPLGCNSNSLDLTVTKNRTVVEKGDVITYAVYVTNLDNGSSIACDITGATVTITLPAADGTPTGAAVTLATGVDYPAGTASILVGTANYTVNVNPGVTDVVAQGNVSGTLHDAPTNHAASITKTVGTSVTQPSMTLTKTASPSSGQAVFTATFTYTITNTSSTSAPLNNVSVDDDSCTTMTFTGGDTNGNATFDVGEQWVYTCKQTFTRAGTFTNTAHALATNTVDSQGITSNQAQATVTVLARTSGLPGLPNTGVDASLTGEQWWSMFLHDRLQTTRS